MDTSPKFIDGPALRKRWQMVTSTFYDRLKRGTLPPPAYPFGPYKPYWPLSVIEEIERRAEETSRGHLDLVL